MVADDGSGPATAALIEHGSRGSACRCVTSGRSTGLPRRRDPQPGDPARAAATIASSSTATASRGRISSRPTGGSPSPAGSSPATACCCRRALTEAVLRDGLEPEAWGYRRWLGAAASAAASTAWRRCCGCRSGRCASCGRRPGRARAPAISASGAPTSTASTASMPPSAAGAREDSDLLVRLLHAGVRRKDGEFATGVLHLWHPAADRSQSAGQRAQARQPCLRATACAPSAGCRLGADLQRHAPAADVTGPMHAIRARLGQAFDRDRLIAARRLACGRARGVAAVVDVGHRHPRRALAARACFRRSTRPRCAACSRRRPAGCRCCCGCSASLGMLWADVPLDRALARASSRSTSCC